MPAGQTRRQLLKITQPVADAVQNINGIETIHHAPVLAEQFVTTLTRCCPASRSYTPTAIILDKHPGSCCPSAYTEKCDAPGSSFHRSYGKSGRFAEGVLRDELPVAEIEDI